MAAALGGSVHGGRIRGLVRRGTRFWTEVWVWGCVGVGVEMDR